MNEETVKFATGAARSKLHGRRDLIPQAAMDAMGRRLELGTKYGENNWRLGGEDFRKATLNHIINHIFDYMENGNSDDANTDAIICNAAFLCQYEKENPFQGIKRTVAENRNRKVKDPDPVEERQEHDNFIVGLTKSAYPVTLLIKPYPQQFALFRDGGNRPMSDDTAYDLLPRVAMAMGWRCRIALEDSDGRRCVEISSF